MENPEIGHIGDHIINGYPLVSVKETWVVEDPWKRRSPFVTLLSNDSSPGHHRVSLVPTGAVKGPSHSTRALVLLQN